MDLAGIGLPTLHARVEQNECDTNRHWNARFYGRAFQHAAETVAAQGSGPGSGGSPGLSCFHTRHIRYHRELFGGAPVTVRSAMVEDGPFAGAVVHVLSSEGRLSATAFDRPGTGSGSLPPVATDELALALPRGVDRAPAGPDDPADAQGRLVTLGCVRPAELDHTGALLFEEIVRRTAIASHHQMNEVGFTPDFVARAGITRMTAEMKVTLHGFCGAGALLEARSRIARVSRRSFATLHRIRVAGGSLVATVEQSLLAVDMISRRAVEVPAFLIAVAGAG